MQYDPKRTVQPPRKGGPRITADFCAEQTCRKDFAALRASRTRGSIALRVWMRDTLLGRHVGTRNLAHASRLEKSHRQACERRILEFPIDIDAREVAEELK